MNPFAHTHTVMRLVHGSLVHWARDLLLEAGVEGVGVHARFQDERTAGDHIVVLPYRMGPWPKLVEQDRPINLLARSGDSGGVPSLWSTLGRQLRDGIDACYDIGAGRPRMLPAVPIDTLPEPLAEWYRSQDPSSDDRWCVKRGRKLFGRLPTLMWTRPLTIRTYYLILASDAAARRGDPAETFSIPALAVITLGLQLRRSLNVSLPSVAVDPKLAGFVHAMAASCEDDLAASLSATAGELGEDQDHRVTVVPVPDLPSDDFANVMRSLDRPLQPAVHVAVQVAVGGGSEFLPGTSPSMNQGLGGRR